MKSYPLRKKSQYGWLGEIPSHWNELFLQQVSSEKCVKNKELQETNVLSLSYGNIVRKKDINSGLVTNDFSTYQIVEPGDIILRFTDLQNDQKSLRSGLVRERGIITSAYVCIKPSINPAYLRFLLHAYDVHKIFYGLGGGIRQSIGFKDVRHLFVPVPPRSEQNQIVRYLDWQVSKIDKLIEGKKRKIEMAKEQKHAIVSRVITCGLNSKAPLKDSGVNWLKLIPAHWRIIKLRNILTPLSQKGRPDLQLLSVVRELGVIIRDIEDKTTNHNYIPDDLSKYKVVKKNQFVINKMKAWQGSYGISDHDGIVSPAYFVFDIQFPNLQFFHYAIRSKVYVNFFAQASDGIRVGQWDLSIDKMKTIPFFVPPEKEQQEIVAFIPRIQESLNSLILGLQREIERLEEFKTRIISDVVTGKMDVRNFNNFIE